MWSGSQATDKYSGTSYEQRWAWVEDKVFWLSSVFAIGRIDGVRVFEVFFTVEISVIGQKEVCLFLASGCLTKFQCYRCLQDYNARG